MSVSDGFTGPSRLSFEEKLDNLAELAVHAININPGNRRPLLIAAETDPSAIKLIRLIAEKAYKRGVTYVDDRLIDPELARLQLRYGEDATASFIPPRIFATGKWLESELPYMIRLSNTPNPDVFADVDPQRAHVYETALEMVFKPQRDLQRLPAMPWLVMLCASEGWAQKVYPHLPAKQALENLWNAVFRMTFADSRDCIDRFDDFMLTLERRRNRLDELCFSTLHFNNERGTNLTVGLSNIARWCGGRKQTTTGHLFTANWPTYECFTTPDWRTVTGMAYITKPVTVHGMVVTGAWVRFKNGVVTESGADVGAESFHKLLTTDAGASRLGEIALVGLDTPVAEEDVIFYNGLLDENAACHMAFGSAYKFALQNGDQLTDAQLEAVGRNESNVHEDMMISDAATAVSGTTRDGRTVPLIWNGHWVKF